MAKTAAVTIKAAVISHIGCVRKNNEDNFFLDGDYMLKHEVDAGAAVENRSSDEYQLYAVCDGMGGLNGGERAALICVERMEELGKAVKKGNIEKEIVNYAIKASDAVYHDAQVSGSKKQGSTMCLLLVHDGIGYVANVGDSRVYVLRMGELVQVSLDHTEVYQQYLQGKLTLEQARLHPRGNIISNYIGQPKEKRVKNYVYCRQLRLCNGDRFLICSDGLTDLLRHDQIKKQLSTIVQPYDVAETLINMALELGGKDNVTCIVGDIIGPELPAPTKEDLASLSTSLETTAETTGN